MKRLGLGINIKRLIKFKSVAVLFTGTAILFYACENDIEKIKAFSSQEDLPTIEIVDFKSMSTDSGKISYTLKAPKVIRYERDGKKYTEFPEGMELKQFDSNGNIISSIRSDYAKQNVLEDKWEANNNVVATNIKGDTLKTEHLFWERENGKIYNDEYVKIISPDQIIWGEGFTSDEQMGGWKIKKPKGNIYITVDNEQPLKNDNSIDDKMDTVPRKSENMKLQFDK